MIDTQASWFVIYESPIPSEIVEHKFNDSEQYFYVAEIIVHLSNIVVTCEGVI